MNTTLDKVNVKELADQAIDGKKNLSDSQGHTLTYIFDPIDGKTDKFDKIDKGGVIR